MTIRLWRALRGRGYRRGMSNRRSGPEPRNPALKGWEGYWVAVKDGKVIAAANNSRDLVPELRKLGKKAHGAVAQYVPLPDNAMVVGVG